MTQHNWKPVEIADDLIAQVRELLTSGAPDLALVEALERDGVRLATATRFVQEIREMTGQSYQTSADAAAIYGIELTTARRWLRTLDRQAVPVHLQDGLVQHGITPATSRDLANDLLEDCRQQDARQGVRLRRLGLQGMVAGGLFTAFFSFVALNGFYGPGVQSMAQSEARWNAITALLTLALTTYSALLWRRHRDARP